MAEIDGLYRKTLEARRPFLKENVLKLVDEHAYSCDDPACDISLGSVRDLLILAGCELTEDDNRRCM